MQKLKKAIAKRQAEEREERRQRILKASRKIFAQKGYIGATVRDIALEAELSPGLIYHYFSSKDDIYGTICEEGFHLLIWQMKKALKDQTDIWEKLTAISEAYVGYYLDYPEYFEIISFKELGFKSVGVSDDILQRLNRLSEQSTLLLRDTVAEGMESGLIEKDCDPMEMAIVLWASVEGLIFIHKRGYLDMYNFELTPLLSRILKIDFKGISSE